MNDQSKFGVHEHGETLTIDLDNKKTNECLKQAYDLHTEATLYFALILEGLMSCRTFTIPCKTCLLDVALQFKDVGSLLEELANGK